LADLILTAYDGKILGPIAKVLGVLMNIIYKGLVAIGIENIGLTIIIFTFIIYTLMFPLTYKQQKFSKLQMLMQPEIKAIQAKYGNKKDQATMQAMQAETQMVYDKYGVSPTGGCGYMLVSMPILFALYRVIYNVPAYVGGVKANFLELANSIQGVNNYQTIMSEIVSELKITNPKTDFTVTDSDKLLNYVVDVLNKVNTSGWDVLRERFSDLVPLINSTQEKVSKMNSFLGLNIADSPLNIIQSNWKGGSILLVILAALIPILAYATQVLNMKLVPQAPNTDPNDQMAKQMQTMNTIMPLMSLFFCVTLPVGMGLYWIAGALFRSIQQYGLNVHWKNIDMDELIAQNQEKAKKKREKMGIAENQINNAAHMSTKKIIESKASVTADSNASKEEALSKAAEARSKAKPGSLSAKANMVKEFNERNNK